MTKSKLTPEQLHALINVKARIIENMIISDERSFGGPGNVTQRNPNYRPQVGLLANCMVHAINPFK